MRAGWRNSMAFFGTRWAPTPTAVAPARMKSATFNWFTPPEAISGTCGNGPLSALMYGAPPSWEHGNTFTKSTPAFHAIITSVGVRAGEDDCILVVREFHSFEIEPGGGQKLRSRIQTAARGLHIPDRACAHEIGRASCRER